MDSRSFDDGGRGVPPSRVMIVEVVHLLAKPDEADALQAGLTAARNVISQSPGYLDSTFHRGIEEPDAFLLSIYWTDVDAHMTGFREGPLFAEWRAHFAHHLASPPKMSHFMAFAGK